MYWLIDMCYRMMRMREKFVPYDPEPYVLRRDGVEDRMVAELANAGHLLQLLATSRQSEAPSPG